MDGDLFEGWFECLVFTIIKPNSVVTLDNAKVHKYPVLYDIASENNIILLFLPPYSPELNPIEKSRVDLKKFLRNFARNFQTIQDAIIGLF
jgi:putative transposase